MTENIRKRERKVAHARRSGPPGALLYELEADAIKALAHPKRLLILDLLSDGEERNVTDLMGETGLSQSNLSQNLSVMRTAGLLIARREGHQVHYRVIDARVTKAVVLMRAVMAEQAENHRFLFERAELKKKERVKRATTLGAGFIVAVLSVTAIGAALHPMLNGGSFTDVEHHVRAMMASRDIGTLFQSCVAVAADAVPSSAPMVA